MPKKETGIYDMSRKKGMGPGMHKMPNGMPMKDSAMKPMMKDEMMKDKKKRKK